MIDPRTIALPSDSMTQSRANIGRYQAVIRGSLVSRDNIIAAAP